MHWCHPWDYNISWPNPSRLWSRVLAFWIRYRVPPIVIWRFQKLQQHLITQASIQQTWPVGHCKKPEKQVKKATYGSEWKLTYNTIPIAWRSSQSKSMSLKSESPFMSMLKKKSIACRCAYHTQTPWLKQLTANILTNQSTTRRLIMAYSMWSPIEF